MELIPSFTIDHLHLQPGIYISRQDSINGNIITTYDIRMTAPNVEPALGASAIHTIEHLMATYLRNDEKWKDKIIYWGPMGCLTGNYLIMKGEYSCQEIRMLMLDAFRFVAEYDDVVPGTAPEACGNHLLHNLPIARYEARRYIERLTDHFCCDYPTL